MQINAINANFTGKRSNIDAFINIDDKTIQQAASLKTLQSIDTEKHRKLNKVLGCALPAAFGISYAAKAAKGTRLGVFACVTSGAAVFLAGMGIANKVERFICNKSETFNNYTEKHPVLSFFGGAAAALATGYAALLGGSAAFDKVVSSKVFNNLAANVKKTNFAAKTAKYTSTATKYTAKQLSKLPSALKETAKWSAGWAPLAVIAGIIIHTIDHTNKVNRTYVQNYTNLKEKQLNLAKKRNAELVVQNDFLLTNPQNKEDLNLVKKPTKDLPQEVLEKLSEEA